jgi:hypothetical protein
VKFRARSAVLSTLLLLLAIAAAEVDGQRRGGRGGWRSGPEREGLPETRGGFTFCRLLYTSVRAEPAGHGWNTDYPASDHNFMLRLSQLTTTHVSRWNDGEPGYAVVRATDPAMFECPFLFASDVGTAHFTEDEVVLLRQYLLKGGFLWVDDFWGESAWSFWESSIRRVLPFYEVTDLPPDHPLLASAYDVREVPQIPSIQFWRRSGGMTSERGAESAEPHLRAIRDEHGRILVLMSHNTDIADGWEREGEDEDFFFAFSGDAYALGINIAMWVLTH